MLTHADLLANLCQVAQARAVREDDLFLNQLPFFHIYRMAVVMGSCIMAGATSRRGTSGSSGSGDRR